MNNTTKNKYNFSITKGSLLHEELRLLVSQIQKLEEGSDVLDFDVLPQNAESAKQTIGREIYNRLQSTDWPSLLLNFSDFHDHDQRLIALFVAANHHEILQDCLIEVYYKRWLEMNNSLVREDISYWIDEKANQRPELLDIKEYTRKKIAQVLYRFLYEAGLVEEGQIIQVNMSYDLVQMFLDKGEKWFLDVTNQKL